MKVVFCFVLFHLTSFQTEVEDWQLALRSDDFQTRETAEKKLTEWALAEQPRERADSLVQLFLQSEDPEEMRRLIQVLFNVHFEHIRDEIPQTGRGFIGISMVPLAPLRFPGRGLAPGQLPDRIDVHEGVLVDAVIPGTPAEKAGLRQNDMITHIDDESLKGEDPRTLLMKIVSDQVPGTQLKLTIKRGEELMDKEVKLMNAEAVPERRVNALVRVDEEKERELLKKDYLRWLLNKRETRSIR